MGQILLLIGAVVLVFYLLVKLRKKRQGRKTGIGGYLAIFLLLFIVAGNGPAFLIEIPFRLVAGWVFFIREVYPEINWDWNAILPSAVALTLFGLGLHAFLKWLYAQWGRETKENPSKDPAQIHSEKIWKPQWSLALITLFFLMFVTSIGFIGAVHQVGWLTTSKEPILVDSWRGRTYDSDAKSNLHNLFLGCKAYWADVGSEQECNADIAKKTTYGYVQSKRVEVVAGGDEKSFLAWGHHRDSKNIFRMDAIGDIKKESILAEN